MRYAGIAVVVLTLAACGQPAEKASAPESPPVETAAPAPTTPAPAAAPQGPSPEVLTKIAAFAPPYNAGDYEAGRKVFAQCKACHTVGAGEPDRVGPNLHGIFGRKAGSSATFKGYSSDMKALGATWDEATMDKWVANPREVVAKTNMAFVGLKNETQRRDLITYLKVETGT